jgi:hypothetical protein
MTKKIGEMAIIVLLVVIIILILVSHTEAVVEDNIVDRWEYMVIESIWVGGTRGYTFNMTKFNELGDEGWLYVGYCVSGMHLFKRKLQ